MERALHSIAAGQNTTFFLATPNEAMSELPRHPFAVDAPEVCVECSTDKGEDEVVLECEKVRGESRAVVHCLI